MSVTISFVYMDHILKGDFRTNVCMHKNDIVCIYYSPKAHLLTTGVYTMNIHTHIHTGVNRAVNVAI